ncbi:MAG TPA: MarR family transcriptional regulator [Opitutaceae bacterium]|nr:MarR family transcriptional regulator [Opitutaceae bacterium]
MPSTQAKSARDADDLLREVVALYQRTQRSVKASCCDASNKESEAVTLLGRKGPLTIQEFAAGMGLEKTWASRLADRLEDRGLARRTKHPDDKRCCLLELTAKGEKARDALEETMNSTASDILSRVPASKRASIEGALATLRDALAGVAADCCSDESKRG